MNFKYAFFILLGIFVLIAGSLFVKSCSVVTSTANNTILNIDKNVWVYEEFVAKYESYKQYNEMYKNAISKLKDIKENSQEYDNLVMQRDGAYNLLMNVVKEYNKMSGIAYQNIWKSKNLPDELKYPEN